LDGGRKELVKVSVEQSGGGDNRRNVIGRTAVVYIDPGGVILMSTATLFQQQHWFDLSRVLEQQRYVTYIFKRCAVAEQSLKKRCSRTLFIASTAKTHICCLSKRCVAHLNEQTVHALRADLPKSGDIGESIIIIIIVLRVGQSAS
jgi:hypothetical protein